MENSYCSNTNTSLAALIQSLRYLRHEHVDLLYWLAKNRDRIGITNLLRELGVQVNYKVARDEGEKEEAIIEDEGYGGLVQEKIEDGDIWSILSDALELSLIHI